MAKITAQNMRDPKIWPLLLKTENECVGLYSPINLKICGKLISIGLDESRDIFHILGDNYDYWCHTLLIPETKRYYLEIDELWQAAKRRYPDVWIDVSANWWIGNRSDPELLLSYPRFRYCGKLVSKCSPRSLPDWAIIEKEEVTDGTQTENT